MRVVRSAPVTCFLALMMLLSGMSDISGVLCVSPTGHEAVEGWSALGCVPEPGSGSDPVEMTEHGPCVDCTDYSLLPAAAFSNRMAASERGIPAAALHHDAAMHEPRAAARSFSPFPNDSPPPNLSPLSLRC